MKNFLKDVKRFVGNVPFTKDAVAMYFCMIDVNTPLPVKGTITATLTYFLSPMDAIPDAIVGLGFTDDASVVVTALAIVGSHITDEHRRKAEKFFGVA